MLLLFNSSRMRGKGSIVDAFKFRELLDNVEVLVRRVYSADSVLPTMLASLEEARLLTAPSEEVVLFWERILATLEDCFDVNLGIASFIETSDKRASLLAKP